MPRGAASHARLRIVAAVRCRLLGLAPPERRKLNTKLEKLRALDFAALRAEIPLKQRGGREAYLADTAAQAQALTRQIESAERDIDAVVYGLFELTPEEIQLLEASLAGKY